MAGRVRASQLYCADWTQLELASAIGIKYQRGDLSASAVRAICEVFASMTIYQAAAGRLVGWRFLASKEKPPLDLHPAGVFETFARPPQRPS